MKSEIPTLLVLDDAVPADLPAGRALRQGPGIGVGRLVRKMTTWPLLGLLWFYQKAVSPSIPAIFGPTCTCRYYPSCSHYAAEALRTHGVLVGLALAAGRLLRCTPFHRGGIDPVPAPGVVRRLCRRIHPRSASL